MKKIISLVLTLVMLVSALAVLPVAAEDNDVAVENFARYLDSGINLVFLMEDGTEKIVPVAAKEMGDEITVGSEGYCVSWAAQSYIDPEYSEATQKLAEALLNYGAAAQLYFNYNTDGLVGDPVTDTSALKGADVTPATVTDAAGIFIGATLILEGTMKLRFYFEGTDVTATVDGEAATATAADGYSYVEVDVMPYNMTKAVTVRVGATTVTYAPINYLRNKVDDPALSTMVASIYAYGVAAEAYVAEENACKHEGIELNVVQVPTIHNAGLKTGECDLCGKTVTKTLNKTEADVKKYNPISSSSDSNLRASFSNQINIVDNILAGGKHFYPAAENDYKGRDLYVEFSFLYNETLEKNSNGYIDIFRIEEENGQSAHPSKLGNYQGHTLYFLNLRDNVSGQWCPYEGRFETGDIDSAAGGIVSGPSMPNHASVSGESEDDYVTIGDYGWHRMGIRVHQEAKIENNKVVYTVKTSFYIDGELVSEYYSNLIAKSYNSLLFTATISNGKLVYSDIADNRNMLFYKIRATYSTSTYYLATADEYATAGDGFVVDVEPIKNPTYEKFTADGDVELNGTRHFKLKNEIEVDAPEKETNGNKVLLISVDGLRPDALANTDYLDILKGMGAYTTLAQTIYPSKTMPAHMSMFHSVTPNMHGMNTNNVYAPSGDLGNGITEVLASQGYTMAMFFDWENMQYLTKVENNVERNYIQWYKGSGERYHERSTIELTNAILDHIENDPTDFTYLYFGMTDQMGHDHNWLSSEYYIAINHIFSNILKILEAVSDEYTVIITTDHGGGGNLGANEHGSSAAVDMTTPVFIIGDGFEAGASLGNEVSILDITPTIADILGVDAEDCWVGRSLAGNSESDAKKAATGLFLSKDAWSNYIYGRISSTTSTENSITLALSGHTGDSNKGLTAFHLNRYAISEMMSLGFRYLSFTVTLEADGSSKTPTYVDLYTYDDAKEEAFFISSCDQKHPNNYEFYYLSGSEIVVDLWGLYSCLTDSTGYGLIFLLSDGLYKKPTNGGRITFSNIELSRELD